MKTKILYLMICGSAAFLVGCGQSNTQNGGNSGQNQGSPGYGSTNATNASQSMGGNVNSPAMAAPGTNTTAPGSMGGNMNDTNAASTNTSDPADATYAPQTSNTWEQTKAGAVNAWQSTKQGAQSTWLDIKDAFNSKNYSYNQKGDYVTNAQQNLVIMDQQIAALSNQVYSANGVTDTNAQAQLQNLEAKRDALNQKLNTVQNSSPDNWEKTKTDFKDSYNDLKADLKQAWQSVTKKNSQ